MKQYRVDVLYNVQEDTNGRHAAWGRYVEDGEFVQGYFPGDATEDVVSLVIFAESVREAADKTYREMNAVDGKEYISRAKLEKRSMSVGDLLRVSDGDAVTLLSCESMGWSEVTHMVLPWTTEEALSGRR